MSKILAVIGVLTGCLLTITGVVGEINGGFRFDSAPSGPRYDYNEDLKVAWGVASVGLLLLSMSCIWLGRLKHPRWYKLASSSVGALLVSAVVGEVYVVLGGLAILGNDSRSWNAFRDDLRTILLSCQLLGTAVGGALSIFLQRRQARSSVVVRQPGGDE